MTDTPFFEQLTEGVDKACKKLPYFLNILYLHGGDDITSLLSADKFKAGYFSKSAPRKSA